MSLCFRPILLHLDDVSGGRSALWHQFLLRANNSLFEQCERDQPMNDLATIDLGQHLQSYFEQNFRDYETWLEQDQDGSGILQELDMMCFQLHDLSLGDKAKAVLISTTRNIIERKLREVCADEFDEPQLLQSMVAWTQNVVFEWMDGALRVMSSEDETTTRGIDSDVFTQTRHHFLQELYHKFCSMRIDELFDIAVDFPDTTPALMDLHAALQRTKMQHRLIQSLSKSYVVMLANLPHLFF